MVAEVSENARSEKQGGLLNFETGVFHFETWKEKSPTATTSTGGLRLALTKLKQVSLAASQSLPTAQTLPGFLPSSMHQLIEVENRQQDRQNDDQHHPAHDQNQHRLKNPQQGGDQRLGFALLLHCCPLRQVLNKW